MQQDILDVYLRTCQKLWENDIQKNFVSGTDPLPIMNDILRKVENSLLMAYGALDAASRQNILDSWQLEFTYEEAEVTVIGHEKDDWYEQYLLNHKKDKINFPFWSRYKAFLRNQGRTSASLDKLDKATDEIISFLGDPNKADSSFEKRGLVVGYVQSGKTGNFIGLVNKSLDVGYNYIIVLGGLHNNLRSQTQRRVDEGVTGKTINGTPIGCGLIKNYQQSDSLLKLEPHTTEKSDFRKNEALLNPISEVKHIFVVKKNVSILNNLANYFQKIINTYQQNQQWVNANGQLKNRSILIIDDECDQASIDTANYSKKERMETDPVPINKGIRSLLCKFEKNSYVGYTATPFANILIDDQAQHKNFGKDLFPSSFIAMLEKPNNYMGPYELFGTNDENAELPLTRIIERDPELKKTHLVQRGDFLKSSTKKGKDIPSIYKEELQSIIKWNDIRVQSSKEKPTDQEYNKALENYIGEYLDVGDGWLPRKHDKAHDPMIWLNHKKKEIPSSLKLAIDSFLLAIAAKLLRGQKTDHCSMLVHVTRYTDCQTNVQLMVKNYCDLNFGRILNGDKNTLNSLQKLWENDFIPTSKSMNSNKNFKGSVHQWSEIKNHLKSAVKVLQDLRSEANVVAIHGESSDELSYFDKPYDEEGFKVIAIGGDKLSRGLTLEGLLISYFLRPTNMYDTLMQMGRWFGYRDGYADLCRIYSQKELLNNYKHISHAFEEVKEMFKVMKAKKLTPKDFGLRILDCDGMMITSVMKSRYAGTHSLKYAGNTPQTTLFDSSVDVLKSNQKLLNDFISSLTQNYSGTYENRDKSHIWNKIKASEILDFFKKYKGHFGQPNLNNSLIVEYIEKQLNNIPKELSEWTVVLFSLQNEDPKVDNHEKVIGNNKIYPVTRGLVEDNEETFNIRAISDTKPAVYDFKEKEIQQFEKNNPNFSGDLYNLMGGTLRPPKRGLLVLYPFIPKFGNITNLSLQKEYQDRFESVDVIVGYRLHFPFSNTAKQISYKANTVMQKLGIVND
jgi:hypothetical protein